MRVTAASLGALVFATAALAHQGVKDPDVKARMHLMMQIKDQMGVLSSMAKGTVAFNPETAKAARDDLRRQAIDVIAAFEKPASDPKSEAVSTIWVSFPEFTQRALTMNAEFQKLDVTSVESLRAGLPAAGATCLSCHRSFRSKTKQ